MGHSEAIVEPGDLRIPGRMNEVLATLTEDGARQFADEMATALASAEETNDLTSVQYVVNAWWVSSLFFTHDNIEKALETAEVMGEGEPLTAEQVGELLGVA